MKIAVWVKAGARQEKIEKTPLEYKVWVREPAEGGKANDTVCRVLADYFDVAPSRVSVVRGPTSHKKIIEIL